MTQSGMETVTFRLRTAVPQPTAPWRAPVKRRVKNYMTNQQMRIYEYVQITYNFSSAECFGHSYDHHHGDL
jgi:hypothetical protein